MAWRTRAAGQPRLAWPLPVQRLLSGSQPLPRCWAGPAEAGTHQPAPARLLSGSQRKLHCQARPQQRPPRPALQRQMALLLPQIRLGPPLRPAGCQRGLSAAAASGGAGPRSLPVGSPLGRPRPDAPPPSARCPGPRAPAAAATAHPLEPQASCCSRCSTRSAHQSGRGSRLTGDGNLATRANCVHDSHGCIMGPYLDSTSVCSPSSSSNA